MQLHTRTSQSDLRSVFPALRSDSLHRAKSESSFSVKGLWRNLILFQVNLARSDSRPVVWMWHHCKYLCIIGWFYDQSGSLVTCFCLFTLNKNLWIERKNRSEVWIKQFLSLHHVLNFLWSCITHNSLCSNSPNKLKIDFKWVILLCYIKLNYVM